MKHLALISMCIASFTVVACSKKPAAESTTAKPAAAPATAATTDDCSAKCMKEGPDPSNPMNGDFFKKSTEEQTSDCSAACADANAPAAQ
jgi:hypothetical protein